MKMRALGLGVFVVLTSVGFVACGDDSADSASDNGGDSKDSGASSEEGSDASGSSSDEDSSTSGDSAEVKITAKEGGTVEAGGASLDIPKDSLGKDVTVTVEAKEPSKDLPDLSSIKGKVYEFGPEGVTFDPPAELTLPIEGKPGTDEKAVVSYLDAKKKVWVDVETTVSGSKATAPIEHFSLWVVRFVSSLEEDAGGPVDCSFTDACGGDPTGSWKLTAACIQGKDKDGGDDNPFSNTCPDAVFEIAVVGTGTAEINSDKTFTFDLNLKPNITVELPAECLKTLGVTDTCDKLGEVFGKKDAGQTSTCTGTVDTKCSCTILDDDTLEAKKTSGTWEADESAGTLTTVSDAADAGADAGDKDPSEYCVTKGSPDELRIKTAKDGTVIIFERM